MFERKPQIKIEQQEDRDHPEIPLFEKLDRNSQEFVAEIYRLSGQSEQEFLENHPDIQAMIMKSEKFWKKKDRYGFPTQWQQIIDEMRSLIGKNIEKPGLIKDKSFYFATMQDLVQLHLLELKDFVDSGQTDFHSKQTDYLAEKILRQAAEIKMSLGLSLAVPDTIQGAIWSIQNDEWPLDTAEKIKQIHYIITAAHHHPDRNTFPQSLLLVKDLWRYVIIKIGKTKGISFEDWERQYNDFFNKLSNINLRKTNE